MHKTYGLFLFLLLCVSGCKDATDDCADLLPNSCPSPAPSYGTEVAPLIQERCLQCHGPGGTAYPARDFTTYDKVFAQRVDILAQVNSCLMPPFNGTPLSADERKILLGWLVCKAPQN